MSIVRAPRAKNFTILPTALLSDGYLSWEARGMLAYLLSKPDHWIVRMDDLIKATKGALGKSSGRDKVYSIINELRAAGYVTREFARIGGEFRGVEYEVADEPDLEAAARYQAENKRYNGEAFGPAPRGEKPVTEKPVTEKPEALDKTERALRIEKENITPGPVAGDELAALYADRPDDYPNNSQATIFAVWHAYAGAFHKRYKVWPIYNVTMGGMMGKLVKRIGAQAPAAAVQYLAKVTTPAVLEAMHPVAMLLKHCETYVTQAAVAANVKKRAGQDGAGAKAGAVSAPAQRQGAKATKTTATNAQVGRAALAGLMSGRRMLSNGGAV